MYARLAPIISLIFQQRLLIIYYALNFNLIYKLVIMVSVGWTQ